MATEATALKINPAAAVVAAAAVGSGGQTPASPSTRNWADRDTPEDSEKRSAVEKSLWWWNLSCAIAHGVQAAAALAIGEARESQLREKQFGGPEMRVTQHPTGSTTARGRLLELSRAPLSLSLYRASKQAQLLSCVVQAA
jgi:hypothetical protein